MVAGQVDEAKRKTRALKKYEAEAIAHPAAAGGAPGLELFSPLGPMIARAETPVELVERINRFVDRHVTEGEGTEFLLPAELVDDGGEASLARHTQRLIGRYVRRMEGVAASRIRLDAFW